MWLRLLHQASRLLIESRQGRDHLDRIGQITVPIDVRRRLHLVPGGKVLFLEKPNGEVVVAKAALAALAQAQEVFADAAADFGVADATDVQEVIDSLRGPGA
ncbi:AbrB/MazE/SpoVT family DNA-binding domain-containing protein [Nakamurella multipartita]|uniref:AbrB/MazE/SpoVT family DNA-binding domain-containing protein n=1 Tax=Nakamurella multipartita TaxID=53461 RepID=UPI00145D1BB4|nr:AbrB/MazE/SpoVT family DNA-binding domain-containing protein [Nakamurella multipartita]